MGDDCVNMMMNYQKRFIVSFIKTTKPHMLQEEPYGASHMRIYLYL